MASKNNQTSRTAFRTKRDLDFFSQKELTNQLGHGIAEWPLVVIKELVDNALDAAEESGKSPTVEIEADETGITVRDNGPGLPVETVNGVLDFSVKASSREAYVAPDRGAQGHALMTLVAMPFVLDRENGRLSITAHGTRHQIACRVDPISQAISVINEPQPAKQHRGTEVRMEWSWRQDADGNVLWPFDEFDSPATPEAGETPQLMRRAEELVRGFAFLNPHLKISLNWFGHKLSFEPTTVEWSKWHAGRATSPHWYEIEHMERLAAAFLHHDENSRSVRTVSDFLREFDGLAGTAKRKAILNDLRMSRTRLSELVGIGGFRRDLLDSLLSAMRRHSKPVSPKRLGILGRDHLFARLAEMGVEPQSFEYARTAEIRDGLPFVLEAAFGWCGEQAEEERTLIAGVNWSPALANPFRRLRDGGDGLEAVLERQRAGEDEPIVIVIHLAHPRVTYADRGKTTIIIDSDKEVSDVPC